MYMFYEIFKGDMYSPATVLFVANDTHIRRCGNKFGSTDLFTSSVTD